MLVDSKNRANPRQLGFNLIELMVTVSVIGILVSYAVPSYRIWMENTKIRNAADSINSGLQKARVEALKRNADVKFVLGVGSAWTIGCVDVTADCPNPIEDRVAKEGSSASVSVVVTPAGATTVIFTGLGRVKSLAAGAPTAPFTQLDVDTSSLTSTDSRELRIILDTGGAGKMCDPYTGLSASDPRKCPV